MNMKDGYLAITQKSYAKHALLYAIKLRLARHEMAEDRPISQREMKQCRRAMERREGEDGPAWLSPRLAKPLPPGAVGGLLFNLKQTIQQMKGLEANQAM